MKIISDSYERSRFTIKFKNIVEKPILKVWKIFMQETVPAANKEVFDWVERICYPIHLLKILVSF